jgi:hypothetical protein
MFASPMITNVAWALTTLLELILLAYLLRRKLYLTHPAFVIYIGGAILQSALAAVVYTYIRPETVLAWNIVWTSQALLILARSMVIVEIVRRDLSKYKGIWALAKRILIFAGVSSLAYSLLLSEKDWHLIVVNLDRGVELSIAVVIVTFLLFAKYYVLPIRTLDRLLAIGFCLYSCVFVINDSLFERWMDQYLTFWNFLDVLTFLATLLFWMKSVYEDSQELAVASVPVLSPTDYRDLSTELNLRLRMLNNQLERMLRLEKNGS